MMRIDPGLLVFFFASLIVSLTARDAGAQTATVRNEIPLQRCDRLPVAILQVDKADKRFLIDTAATSILNEKSFTSGHTKEVHVTSWNQTTALNAHEVSIGEFTLGNHSLRGVRLPAIDLTAIAKACGGPLDGILGVDLLEQLGVTIDLKRSVARLGVAAPSVSEESVIADMEQAMHSCAEAFNNADADRLAFCFDPDFILSSPSGELRGRDQATNHFRKLYFDRTPHFHLSMSMNDQRAVGDVVWSLYDYTIESPSVHTTGRGMMLCRKFENHWYILSMHESPIESSSSAR
ncbi:MAG TPA: nuclear transport factor 2 family protein [Candidatus Polarisedimenticolia bacterium]|nr:nuclear transport factor 2 family protein [Candidatus Polarisedimenticolia bacterium]